MKELTTFELEQVGGGVIDAEVIISAAYIVCPGIGVMMTVGYYLNKQC